MYCVYITVIALLPKGLIQAGHKAQRRTHLVIEVNRTKLQYKVINGILKHTAGNVKDRPHVKQTCTDCPPSRVSN